MERRQVIEWKLKRIGVDHRRQQVNRIPDTAVQHTVSRGKHGHRDASCQSTFDACGHRINFDGNSQTVSLRGGACDLRPRGDDGRFLRVCGHGFMTFVGQHIAEPADRSHHYQNDANHAQVGAGEQTGEQKRGAEGENNRPRGRRRKLDRFGRTRALILFHIHRPMM